MLGPLRFGHLLGILLFAGFAARLVYVVGQGEADPTYGLPILDGAYYTEWARALAAGRAGPLAGHPAEAASAYYLAPLYPIVLSAFLRVFGENFALIFYAQQLLVLLSACFLALAGRRLVDEWSGLAAAALWLAYHPALFFASKPLGEALALVLLASSLWVGCSRSRASGGLAGLLSGIAALARPNLLIVAAAWAGQAILGRRWRYFGLFAAGVLVALLPTSVRNFSVSGHVVPVSANAGLTLYHGNGAGAQGIGWNVEGLSGRLSRQQAEATRLAGFLEGRPMDPVEADRYWGRRAVNARLSDLSGSLGLGARRLALLASNEELSLDYAPDLDARPLRWLAPLPFAALLGLAGAGVFLRGFSGSGGRWVWTAAAACALTPLVFYVSSRYRLPLSAMLCIPAGAGLASLASGGIGRRRRSAALVLAVVVASISWVAPTGGLEATSEAAARANRAAAWIRAGDHGRAERELERALELDPDSVAALEAMSALLERSGRAAEFDEYYRRALANHPGTLQERWRTVILQKVAAGEIGAARRAAQQALREGVELEPELQEKLVQAGDRSPRDGRKEGARTR